MITSLSIGRGGLGRFGNQMFTIAGVIGIAERSGQPYGFPRWKTYDNALFGNPVDDIEDYLVNELPRAEGIDFQDYGYFWGYRDIKLPFGNWSIDAHMQSFKFFAHCVDKVREAFRFKDEPPQNDCVAIHYRAGDYIDNPDAYHPRCSKEYYERAIKLFHGEHMIIFSDDPEAAMNHLGLPNMLARNCHYIDDFKYMKKCKSFITANSSFSFMAALLGEHPDKKIVMPRRWFGTQANGLSTADIYPENSIVI